MMIRVISLPVASHRRPQVSTSIASCKGICHRSYYLLSLPPDKGAGDNHFLMGKLVSNPVYFMRTDVRVMVIVLNQFVISRAAIFGFCLCHSISRNRLIGSFLL